MKRVAVFGIFDGIHEGHRALFQQARTHGDELVVAVGRDEVCQKLKHKTPRFSEEERVKLVAAEPLVDKAILGDRELSAYTVLEELDPDVVCVGYDQQELYRDLSSWIQTNNKEIKFAFAKPWKSEIYKNSLIRKE